MGDVDFWMVSLMFLLMIILGIIVAFLFSKNKKNQKEPDYYAFFIMGLVWLIAGIIVKNNPLWIVGFIFLLLSLYNHKKWKQNEFKWKDLSKFEKRLRIWITVALSLILIASFFVLYFLKRSF
jgi:chromate transport protein ChrA